MRPDDRSSRRADDRGCRAALGSLPRAAGSARSRSESPCGAHGHRWRRPLTQSAVSCTRCKAMRGQSVWPSIGSRRRANPRFPGADAQAPRAKFRLGCPILSASNWRTSRWRLARSQGSRRFLRWVRCVWICWGIVLGRQA
jgi:hypothetical protein